MLSPLIADHDFFPACSDYFFKCHFNNNLHFVMPSTHTQSNVGVISVVNIICQFQQKNISPVMVLYSITCEQNECTCIFFLLLTRKYYSRSYLKTLTGILQNSIYVVSECAESEKTSVVGKKII